MNRVFFAFIAFLCLVCTASLAISYSVSVKLSNCIEKINQFEYDIAKLKGNAIKIEHSKIQNDVIVPVLQDSNDAKISVKSESDRYISLVNGLKNHNSEFMKTLNAKEVAIVKKFIVKAKHSSGNKIEKLDNLTQEEKKLVKKIKKSRGNYLRTYFDKNSNQSAQMNDKKHHLSKKDRDVVSSALSSLSSADRAEILLGVV